MVLKRSIAGLNTGGRVYKQVLSDARKAAGKRLITVSSSAYSQSEHWQRLEALYTACEERRDEASPFIEAILRYFINLDYDLATENSECKLSYYPVPGFDIAEDIIDRIKYLQQQQPCVDDGSLDLGHSTHAALCITVVHRIDHGFGNTSSTEYVFKTYPDLNVRTAQRQAERKAELQRISHNSRVRAGLQRTANWSTTKSADVTSDDDMTSDDDR